VPTSTNSAGLNLRRLDTILKMATEHYSGALLNIQCMGTKLILASKYVKSIIFAAESINIISFRRVN
jgi:predicted nucleotidyltransferase